MPIAIIADLFLLRESSDESKIEKQNVNSSNNTDYNSKKQKVSKKCCFIF
jgi:hypothetical protein